MIDKDVQETTALIHAKQEISKLRSKLENMDEANEYFNNFQREIDLFEKNMSSNLYSLHKNSIH